MIADRGRQQPDDLTEKVLTGLGLKLAHALLDVLFDPLEQAQIRPHEWLEGRNEKRGAVDRVSEISETREMQAVLEKHEVLEVQDVRFVG